MTRIRRAFPRVTIAAFAVLALTSAGALAQEQVPAPKPGVTRSPAPAADSAVAPATDAAPPSSVATPDPGETRPTETPSRPGPAPAPHVSSPAVNDAPVNAAATTAEPATTAPATAAPQETASAPLAIAEPEPPADLLDLDAWLAWRRAAHRIALPDEARLFFRRGLIADRAGQHQDAMRLVRGAAELDPGFVTPHLTLASWNVTRDPGQTLVQYGIALDIVRRSFLLQIELVANLAFFAMHALFVGLVATALAIVLIRQAELRHLWQERLARLISPGTARAWAWVILALPFACGVGLALPAVLLLGLVWPVLRSRERTIYVLLVMTLVTIPLASGVLGRLAAPLRVEEGPLYGVAELQDATWTPARSEELATLAAHHPDNPVVQFGFGWVARQGGDLAAAENAYRRAATLWPQNDRVLNNLGNVLVAQGRANEAATCYRRAVKLEPENAAAWFNLSQIYTRQFEYHEASEAAAKASAIDFEMVKAQQALGTDDGVPPLADQWLTPSTLWTLVLESSSGPNTAATPATWRGRIETLGWRYSLLVGIVALLALVLGIRWQRAAPLRPCHNCGRIVCRRCARRSRELALCPACGNEAARAESPEFIKVLLGRRRLAVERSRRIVRTALASLIPGYGLLAFHRAFRTLLILSAMVLLTAPWLGVYAPFTFQSPTGAGSVVSPVLALGCWILLYAFSLLGYLAAAARESARARELAAPVRSRPSQATPVTAKAA